MVSARPRRFSRDATAALEALLVVPEGKRRSDLDRLRRPPFSPTIAGPGRKRSSGSSEVRALGVGGLDLRRLPPGGDRPGPLTPRTPGPPSRPTSPPSAGSPPSSPSSTYSTAAPATTSSTSPTSSSAISSVGHQPRPQRRTSELRDYDRAVGELQSRMQAVLDALDDDAAIAIVLAALRQTWLYRGCPRDGDDLDAAAGRSRSTNGWWPPASVPQIRRFFPADRRRGHRVHGACTPRPDAYALGRGLPSGPAPPGLPDTEVPLQVVTASWEPHVRDREDGHGRIRSRLRLLRARPPPRRAAPPRSGLRPGQCPLGRPPGRAALGRDVGAAPGADV